MVHQQQRIGSAPQIDAEQTPTNASKMNRFIDNDARTDIIPLRAHWEWTVGTGCGIELGRALKPGDVVELEIEKIGVLRNRITRRPRSD